MIKDTVNEALRRAAHDRGARALGVLSSAAIDDREQARR
jgi:hypothetical protein